MTLAVESLLTIRNRSVIMNTEGAITTMYTNCFIDSSESSEHISLEMAKDPSTATFSLEDIYMFIRSFNIKLMLVVSNAGKIYYMVRKETFSFEGALTLAHEAADKYINAITLEQRIDATKYFLHNCNKFGILYGH